MSGFPLDPKKTVSGIVVDPQTLERVVPNTKRKDGTVRKELKIRPGYTPTEDVARYRSTGQRDTARLKGFVPGASSATSSTYFPPSMSSESDYPSLSKAARKNLNRRANKKGKEDLEKEEEDAEDWDAEDGDANADGTYEAAKAMEAMSLAEKAKKEKEEEEAKGKASLRRAPRPGGGLFRELGIKAKEKPTDESTSTTAEQMPKEDLIELSPPDANPETSTSQVQDDTPSPPILAPPVSASSSSSTSPSISSTKPKVRPPKSLLPSSLLASSPSTSSPAPPSSSSATKSTPKSVPGSSSTSKPTTKPGAASGSARTRPEPKTRPGFSPMGQINGLLGGGPAPRTKRE